MVLKKKQEGKEEVIYMINLKAKFANLGKE